MVSQNLAISLGSGPMDLPMDYGRPQLILGPVAAWHVRSWQSQLLASSSQLTDEPGQPSARLPIVRAF